MNTLIKPRQSVAHVYEEHARANHLDVDTTVLNAAFNAHFKALSKARPCYGHGAEGSRSWWRSLIVSVLQQAGSGPVPQHVADKISNDLYDKYARADAWQLIDAETPSILTRLRMRGISLCVVSNFDIRLKTILAQLGIADHFSMFVLSGELGYEKPDGRMFDIVLRNLDLADPATLLHVGDDLEKDYRSARAFGARALLFDPSSKHADTVPNHDRILSFSQLSVY